MANDADMVGVLENVGRITVPELEQYFSTPPKEGEANGDRVDRALKLLGVYSRVRATRANEAAVSVAIAKQAGLKGEALHPIWERLTGQPVHALLPDEDERSGGAAGRASENQQDAKAHGPGKGSARNERGNASKGAE